MPRDRAVTKLKTVKQLRKGRKRAGVDLRCAVSARLSHSWQGSATDGCVHDTDLMAVHRTCDLAHGI